MPWSLLCSIHNKSRNGVVVPMFALPIDLGRTGQRYRGVEHAFLLHRYIYPAAGKPNEGRHPGAPRAPSLRRPRHIRRRNYDNRGYASAPQGYYQRVPLISLAGCSPIRMTQKPAVIGSTAVCLGGLVASASRPASRPRRRAATMDPRLAALEDSDSPLAKSARIKVD